MSVFITLISCLYISFGNEYTKVSDPKTASDAQDYCHRIYGTSLATIMNANDNAKASLACAGECLIGLNDINNEGTFKNFDGTPGVYTNWVIGWNNNGILSCILCVYRYISMIIFVIIIDGEDCVEIVSSSSRMNTVPCNDSLPFLCNAGIYGIYIYILCMYMCI